MVIKNLYLCYLLYFLTILFVGTFLIVIKNKKKEIKLNFNDRDIVLVKMENTIGTWINDYKKD